MIEHYRWSFQSARLGRTDGYAVSKDDAGAKLYMHRLVARAGDGEHVDHINGDGLDNRRCNLRLCTHADNCANRVSPLGPQTSRYKGVYYDPRGVWEVYICAHGRKRPLGLFRDEVDAAHAYDLAARAQWGAFARLNLPDDEADPAQIEAARIITQQCAYTGATRGLRKRGGDGRCQRKTITADGLCWAHRVVAA